MADPTPVILVLDDESLVTTTIKNYLQLRGGYEVVVFNDPQEALDYVTARPVDLIISDQIMPKMNGLEFFERVREIQPEAIRVLLTGYAHKDDAVRAINQIGLFQYLEKPWSNDQLDLVIRNGLERKRLYTTLQERIGQLHIAADEIARLKNGLVELYLEKGSAPGMDGKAVAAARSELQKIVGTEVRSGTRKLLYAFVVVSALLLASVSYIVYSSFFSIRREAAGLQVELTEIKRKTLNEAEIKRLRAVMTGEQIIAEYEESVCFIQGSYIFRDKDSGKILRLLSPEQGSAGNVGLTVGGDGPPLENFYTGTGFLVTADGRILTNRHVAEPWWADRDAQRIVEAGFRPELRSFLAYFPHRQQPLPLKTHKIAAQADLALLQVMTSESLPKPIPLETGIDGVAAGAAVLLIGFPLGLEAILARASDKELDQIPNLPNLTLEQVARELAKRDLIRPSVTQGHISNVTEELLVYDAATTMGGSGGPLLNRQGKVIAINFAVMTQFTGASMGLRIQHAMELLKD